MSNEQDPLIGQMIQNYQIAALLGQGGVGRVYLARHPGIGKRIAIKVLRREFAQNQNILARFFREAQSVNEIRHENVIDIFNLIQHEGQTFILMEFLDGRPLSMLVKNHSVFNTQRVANIALQCCSALYATHNKGIIHRDLKPDNIFLINRGGQKDFVKLLDFGLARSLGEYTTSPHTPLGVTLGTPAYMSPEQALGDPVDLQTDVYALGVILYEMVTGGVPFLSDSPRELMKKQVLGKVQPPRERNPNVEPALEEVILRCLQKEKRARYPHMKALALALGYVSGLDPSIYFQQEQSSQKLPVVRAPIKAEQNPFNELGATQFTSDSEPDLGKTIPEEGNFLARVHTSKAEEQNPFVDGEGTGLLLTESMVEASSVKIKSPSDSDEA
jgi:serine/threonine protein kinase